MTLLQTPASCTAPGRFPRLDRAAGAAWFVLLAAFYGRVPLATLRHARPAALTFAAQATLLSSACTLVFFLTLAWLMLVRPPAAAQRAEWAPRAVSLLGTYGVWTVAFLPQAALSPALAVVAATVTLVGGVLIVSAILHLGRSFSIAPQARALITTGPYALARHPLYAAEEIAIVGVTLHVAWWGAVPFLLAHLALQLRRMTYEERLLASVFPEYAAYAARTARLIPGVW